MLISLKTQGQKRDFTVGHVTMLTVRRAMDIQEKVDFERITPAQLDMIVDLVVEAFDHQFTREDFYKGMPAKGFIRRLIEILGEIVNMLVSAAEEMGE
jgi:hypothetical protein